MPAFYAGLDVSDLTTAICVIDAKGDSVFEVSVETTPAAIAQALKPYSRVLKKVGHETGAKSIWLQKELAKKRLPIVCLDARIAHDFLKSQRNKTDKKDARGLAQLLRVGFPAQAYTKSDEALRMRLLLTHRRALKRKAASLEHSLRMTMKMFGARLEKKAGAVTVKQATRSPDRMLTRMSETMLRARSALMDEVKVLDELVARAVKADPVCRRLMTVPGVGPLTSLTFRAGVDDPTRFASSRTVGAYFGLTPKRYQSGKTDIDGHISRLGDVSVRAALFEAAFILLTVSKSKCALRAWGLRLREEKGLRFACVACARKLAVILHRMWITERDFDPRPVLS